jgi:hypothetical protein
MGMSTGGIPTTDNIPETTEIFGCPTVVSGILSAGHPNISVSLGYIVGYTHTRGNSVAHVCPRVEYRQKELTCCWTNLSTLILNDSITFKNDAYVNETKATVIMINDPFLLLMLDIYARYTSNAFPTCEKRGFLFPGREL